MYASRIIFINTIVRHYIPGMLALDIPATVVKKLGGKFSLRLKCKVNGELEFQTGFVAAGKGRALVSINKKRMKELGVIEGSRVDVELTLDKTKYGMPVPEELEELLAQDDEGRKRFEGLTMGKRRYVIFYVSQVKAPDKRLERAMFLIENLKLAPEGKETFRDMLGMPPRKG